MNTFCKSILVFLFISAPFLLCAQIDEEDSSGLNIAAYVQLDSVVINASKSTLNIDSFISIVRNDRSFYYAFQNLRRFPFLQTAKIDFYNKKSEIEESAQYVSRHKKVTPHCYKIKTLHSRESEKYRNRKGKVNNYTSTLFERVFLPEDRHCKDKNDTTALIEKDPDNRIERYINELKKLMFLTGSESDIPFIGDKTAIFSTENRKYYNYHITADTTRENIPIYSFSIQVKDEYRNSNDVVIQSMSTDFKRDDFTVLRRQYSLEHNTMAYEFIVSMNIQLKKSDKKYYPSVISYNGNWDLPFKQRERCKFEVLISNFNTNEEN